MFKDGWKFVARFIGWLIVAATGVYLTSIAGEFLRESIPARFHRGLFITGMGMFGIAVAGYIRIQGLKSEPTVVSPWGKVILALAALGFVLSSFFVTGVECKSVLGWRATYDCRYVGTH